MTSSPARERPPVHEAVRDVYERRGAELFAFAWRLLESTSLAEDAVHEAVLRVFDGRCRVDPSRRTLDLLLFGIVRNVAREVRRGSPESAPGQALEEDVSTRSAGVPGWFDPMGRSGLPGPWLGAGTDVDRMRKNFGARLPRYEAREH